MEILAPKNETANRAAFDPKTFHGYAARSVEALKGMAEGVVGLFATPMPGTEENPIIWNPITQVEKDWQGIKSWNALREANPDYAWGSILGPILLTHTVSKLIEPAGMTAKLARGAGVDPAYIEPVVADLRSAAKGAKPKTVGDFVDVASKAEKKLNDEFDKSLGAYGHWKSNLPDVDGNFPISQAIKALKERMPAITDADRAERTYIDKAAAEYEHPISLHELDLKRMQANGRLSAYYDKNDVAQYAAETKNAQILIDKAVANWVRDNVYPEMDQLTGKPPGYFRNLKARAGNLMNAQSEAEDFASKVHRQSAVERGSTPLERVRPGGAVSMRGGIHGYISNIPQMFRAADPEGEANAAVRSGFGIKQRISPPPESLTVPLSVLTGSFPKGPATRKLEELRNGQSTPAVQ
jgi:hypothetical protein